LINKLYHQKKIVMNNKGLNRVATAKGIDSTKSHEDILNV
jgi:hypothetical protein